MMEDLKAQKRDARTQETREASFKRIESWRLPDTLPMPDERPGWKHRYIRVESLGQSDARNISSKLREGYEPVKAEDYPELMTNPVSEGQFKGGIEIGGLLLCRIPEEYLKQREEYFAKQNQAQMESVDQNYMRENHPHMRKFSERSTEVTFGSGSK
jgi:hypothetical protein